MMLAFTTCAIYLLLDAMLLEFTFSNGSYRIRQAHITLFRSDASSHIKSLPNETKRLLYANEASIKQYLGYAEAKIADGLSEILLSDNGVFRAMLTDIVIVRSSDGSEFKVPCYVASDFSITKEDIRARHFKIEINEPLVKVFVVDQEERVVTERLELGFEKPTDGPTKMTFEVQTDRNGELIFLGDPLKYKPNVLDKPWLQIRTERLY